ncbi:hypothetical protein F383_14937 [Gossypium arboreum]|uniref:Uncharacterized protein n=1 Tax=Gossypium arboreum TaxID=29729 RepID=A0A0B0PX31_GOSAR|nr:hypothetical protein F383_14937 [Gossypium arboreum]
MTQVRMRLSKLTRTRGSSANVVTLLIILLVLLKLCIYGTYRLRSLSI